ncbi:hypothetical protein SLEP1_g54241 [Rubroshorea leprosula]|uniref:non-specific serine/threonine protein kinase n=1 Tax=Rubroshorea leprosula TaxID=152421 RepID=A0AAV5MBS5_9ROSI|nr:hypothetical protein SLEP1_g54241 [Rubroshorea leprosula]
MPSAAVSLFLFLVLTSLEILLSAGEEEWPPKKCPPFKCGNFNAPGVLSTGSGNLSAPGCGIFPIKGCNETVQKIQLEKGRGRWYTLEGMSQGERIRDNKITIQDDELLQSTDCQFFVNLPLSNSTGNSFRIRSSVAILNCSKSHPKNAIPDYFTHINRSCNNRSVYYRIHDVPLDPNLNVPSTCSLVYDSPLMNLPSYNKDHFTPLIANLTIHVEINLPGPDHDPDLGPDPCHACRKNGGCSSHCTKNRKGKLALKLGVGFAGSTGFLIILSIVIIRLCAYKKKRGSSNFTRGNTSSSLSWRTSDLEGGGVCFGVEVPLFSYGELEEATNNFDHKKELGNGGFGTVYHGKLKDGREVAIKRLYDHNYKRVEQFKNEVQILARLRHQNLVSLYGCTSRHSRELLLVYEFIPNGTVADHIHGDQAKPGSFPWPVRMSIAIETATALAYLHASGIIHRDVKTNNILLDNNFCVKVADFGLSRLFPNNVTHISTAPQGTPGYVDPDYHQCYQLTEKSDVYSFGVVLIELISSMPPVDISRHRHEINLANLAINKIQKSAVDELIDPTLGYKSDENIRRMTTSVAELAFKCLKQEKEMRPSMVQVLQQLKRIQGQEPNLDNYMEEGHLHIEELNIFQPPPSPQTSDEVALLKNIRQLSSPTSVTAKWVSISTTPNNSR